MSLTQQDITRLGSYFVSKSGGIVQGELTPDEDLTHDLGRSDHRWDTIYAGTVIADNIQSGSGVGDADTVDGFDAAGNPIASTLLALDPQGVFPITVYPTALLKDGSRALEGNLTVVADATIDGVDIGDHTHTGVGSMGLQLTHGDLLSLDADDHLQYAERAQDETITGDWMFTHLINRSAGWLFLPDDKVFKAVPHNLVLKADENEASIGIGPYESSEYAIYLFDDTTPTTYVKVGRGNDSITLHGTDATYRIWAGHVDAASAPFRVEKDGSIYATDGEIAGWTIDSTSISKNDMVLHSTGYIAAGTGDNLVRIDSQDATWRLWAGNAVAANAPFRVNKTGDLYIGSGYVSGTFRSTNFISGQSGFGLNSSGLAEFDNIIARGRLQATVFAEATIAVASGKLIISDGAVLGADMADTDDYFVVDAPVFLQNDIVRLKPDVNRDEWMRITSPYVADPDGYKYFVIRELNSGEGGYAGPYDFYAGESVVRLGSAEQVNLAFPLASGEEGGEYGEYQPGGSGSTTGGGFLILEGSRQFGPYFGVAARYGPVYDQLLDVVRIGNLDGVLDYTSEEWGAFFGDSNAFMTYDQTQGLRIEFSGTGVDTTIDDTGIATETISIAKVTAPGSSVDPFGYLYHDTSDNLLYWKYGATSYDLTAGAAGAPSSAQYVVMALSGGLSAERRLQGTALQITLTDGGAEGDATLSLPSAITLTGASSISTSSSTLSLTPVGNLILNPTALITLSKGLSADWDAGDFEIRSNTFESDVATGTAPLVIASTTLVANLNADRVDSIEGTALAEIANTESITGPWTFGTNAPIFDIQQQIKGITAPGAGPTGYGNLYAKTDGKLYFHYFGGSEVDLTGAGVTDHGALSGLDDDDHGAVYGNIGTAENITGAWTFDASGGLSVRNSGDVTDYLTLIASTSTAALAYYQNSVAKASITLGTTFVQVSDLLNLQGDIEFLQASQISAQGDLTILLDAAGETLNLTLPGGASTAYGLDITPNANITDNDGSWLHQQATWAPTSGSISNYYRMNYWQYTINVAGGTPQYIIHQIDVTETAAPGTNDYISYYKVGANPVFTLRPNGNAYFRGNVEIASVGDGSGLHVDRIERDNGDITMYASGGDIIFDSTRLYFTGSAQPKIWSASYDIVISSGTRKTVIEHASSNPVTLEIGNEEKVAGQITGEIDFRGWDSLDAEQVYASIKGVVVDPLSTSVDGRLEIWTYIDNTETEIVRIEDDIAFYYETIHEVQLQLKGITAPGAGPSGYGHLFAKTDGKLYFHYFGGSEVDLTAGATTLPHILATSGPHTGELPWTDMAAGTQGSIVRRGAADWEEYALGTTNYVLKAGATDVAWGQVAFSELTGDIVYTQLDSIVDTSGGGSANYISAATHVHTDADGSTKVGHGNLSGVSIDQHHARDHDIEGGTHTASGLTIGHVMRASGASAFSFAALIAGDIPTLDHGTKLTGLDDDDHGAVYPGIAGTETITGNWAFSTNDVQFELQLELKGIAAPGAGAAGYGHLYAKTDGKLYFHYAGGAEIDLTASGLWSDQTTYLRPADSTDGLVIGATTAPDGLVHIFEGSAGSVAADGGADTVVFEMSGDGGVSFLKPNANWGQFVFGSPGQAKDSWFSSNYDLGRFDFVAASHLKFDLRNTSGTMVWNENSYDVDMRWEGSNEQNMLVIDGGLDQLAIGTATPFNYASLTVSNVGEWAGGDPTWNVWVDAYTEVAIGPTATDAGVLYMGALRGDTNSAYSMITLNAYWQPTDITWYHRDSAKYATNFQTFVSTTTAESWLEYTAHTTFSSKKWFHLKVGEIFFNPDNEDMDIRFETDTLDDTMFINSGDEKVIFHGQSISKGTGYGVGVQTQAGATKVNDMAGFSIGNLETSDTAMNFGYLDYTDGGFHALFGMISTGAYFDKATEAWVDESATYGALYYTQQIDDTAGGNAHYFYYEHATGTAWHELLRLVEDGGAVFNANGTSTHDFRVQTANLDDAIFIDSGDDFVGFGLQSSPLGTDQWAFGSEDDYINFGWYSWDTTPLIGLNAIVVGGTEASPSATPSGSFIGLGLRGWDSTNLYGGITPSYLGFETTEAFTATAHGTKAFIRTTVAGTLNRVENVVWNGLTITVNPDSANMDFIINGDTEKVFTMDAGLDSIIVGPKTTNAMPDTTTSRLMIFSDGSAPSYPLGTVTEGASNIFQQLSTGTSASFGAGFLARYARGTFASPTQTQSGDRLGFFLFGGRDNVGGWGNQAGFLSYTTQAYTATARGTKFQIVATSDGASSRTVIMEFQDGAILGNPTGGDLGAGILNVDVDVYLDNSKYTNPDYVFEHYYTGKIEKFIESPGALQYGGLMSIAEVAAFTEKYHYLPWIEHDDPSGLGGRGDMVLAGQETLMLYIIELEERIRKLEAQVLH